MAHFALQFNQRLTQGHLVEPAADSAKSYLAQMVQADATHPSTVLAHQALGNRILDEAKSAAQHQDYPGARRWLTEARDAGSEEASIAAVERDITVAQEKAAQEKAAQDQQALDNTPREPEIINAGELQREHYVPPTFPATALEKGVSGWVDLQFLVQSDGQLSDVITTGAEPAGMFEQVAVDAVKKWRYKPMQRNGHAVDQRARLRMKFALDKR
jgi:protein TonB